MNASPVSSVPARGAAATALLAVLLLIAAPPLAANPLPDACLLVHVQPHGATPDPITFTNAGQIEQYTGATGRIEFDVFATTFYPTDWPVSHALLNVTWSSAWQLVSVTAEHGGAGNWMQTGPSQASLDIYWPDCPTMSEEVFLLARFIFDLEDFGALDLRCGTGVDLGCPPETWPLMALTGAGQAGVVCTYCYLSCGYPQETGSIFPTLLELEAFQGETAMGTLQASCGGTEFPICLDFDTTESWLTLSEDWTGYHQATVTVTADATTLEPGVYEGWVRALSDCVACTRVVFTVEERAQGIPEDPLHPGPARLISWGTLKGLYR